MLGRFVTLLACAGCSDRIERVLALEGEPAAGAEVWAVHCEECHASDGTGTAEGPDLTDEPEPAAELADKVLYGWGTMEGFANDLTNQDVADLVAFLEQDVVP